MENTDIWPLIFFARQDEDYSLRNKKVWKIEVWKSKRGHFNGLHVLIQEVEHTEDSPTRGLTSVICTRDELERRQKPENERTAIKEDRMREKRGSSALTESSKTGAKKSVIPGYRVILWGLRGECWREIHRPSAGEVVFELLGGGNQGQHTTRDTKIRGQLGGGKSARILEP